MLQYTKEKEEIFQYNPELKADTDMMGSGELAKSTMGCEGVLSSYQRGERRALATRGAMGSGSSSQADPLGQSPRPLFSDSPGS